ncbi:MAG: calcium/proton exchanger [Cyanobacteria bacterium HKST-UBA02]|nr:calcium/proton exchanger [Cyanobacteria bacterium HKST-UBA02]
MLNVFTFMLLAVPMTWVAHHLGWSPLWVAGFASLGIIPVAKYMGEATENVSHRVGPSLGGLVSATFGNACELIIAIMAVRAGLIDVVKASITGSIIGNLLLVLGASMLFGGIKNDVQSFNRTTAGTAATVLTIVAVSLMLPAALHHTAGGITQLADTGMAIAISVVLLVLYVAGLVFSLRTHRHLFTPVVTEDKASKEDEHAPGWSLGRSAAVLLGATLTVVFLSEYLVESVEHASKTLGMTPVFVGVILLAIIGNAAENSSAILMARKNKMDLSINIVLGSSTQIAMFVAPVVVFAGWIFGQPMDLVFSEAEILAVFSSVIVLTLVVNDGKSHWLEGAYLLGLYVILGICFYFIP